MKVCLNRQTFCYRIGGVRVKTIQIIGAGAVGMLMATYLVEQGNEVHLICRRQEQVNQLLKNGLQRENLDGTYSTFFVQAKLEIINDADLTIVAVKSNEVEALLPALPIHTPLLFVQNGLAHYLKLKSRNLPNLAFGSAQFGALKHHDTFVSHRGFGPLKIAYFKCEHSFLEELLSQEGDFVFKLEEHALNMLIEKAIINSLINPITALLQIPNGQLIENEETYRLVQSLHEELMHVFPQQCPSFSVVKELCNRTKNNRSSMLQDHLALKVSEAPAILGALIEQAQLNEKKTPILMTIYQLVLAKEKQGGFQ